MSDLYLGLIALGVVVMATIQVAAVVVAIRAARRVGEMATRFEQDVRPIVVNLQKVSEEAARASAQAAAQVNNLDTLVSGIARRVEDTALTLQQTILQPAREGLSLLAGFKGLIDGFLEPREPRRHDRHDTPSRQAPSPGSRPTHPPSDDELFIG